MFEIAELGRKLPKKEYKPIVRELRTQLLEVQRALASADFPVIILLNGVEGAGKGEALNLLHEWMDARFIHAHALGEPTAHELEHPEYWRFWMALPPRGRIGVYVGNWYTQPIVKHVFGASTDAELDSHLARVNAFEKALVDDGALILKFWFHLSKDAQAKRLKKLAADRETAWRVTRKDRKYFEKYDDFRRSSERALRKTSTGEVPWMLIEGTDARYRNVTLGQRVLQRVQTHVAERAEVRPSIQAPEPVTDPLTILDRLDLSRALSRNDYEKELERWQGRLATAARKAHRKKVGATIVFEGWDASGKGGAIRRMIRPLDARQYHVIPVSAPTDEELAHHYLWRFWRHVPPRGKITIYDRSWYGRVLVERVEGLASEPQWRRAYKEINDFEEQLVEHGTVLVKFWLHISSEEQLRRFEERERIPYKRHKITEEDYRNREKNHLYELAANEMIGRTSTDFAPWTLVEAEDKHYGRIKVLRTVCEALENALARAKDK